MFIFTFFPSGSFTQWQFCHWFSGCQIQRNISKRVVAFVRYDYMKLYITSASSETLVKFTFSGMSEMTFLTPHAQFQPFQQAENSTVYNALDYRANRVAARKCHDLSTVLFQQCMCCCVSNIFVVTQPGKFHKTSDQASRGGFFGARLISLHMKQQQCCCQVNAVKQAMVLLHFISLSCSQEIPHRFS